MKNYKTICQQSILEQDYVAYLKSKEIKVVSFDIFDTLVYRKEGTPSALFKKMAKDRLCKEIFYSSTNFIKQRVEAEKQARKNCKEEEISLVNIYNELNLSKREKKQLIKLELEYEHRSLFINKQVKSWIKKALKHGKQVIFISDIYFTKKQLLKLVFEKLNVHVDPSSIFVSSELKLSKATSNIYPIVLQQLGQEASSLLHIGDNEYSDIQMALKHGLKTLHYSSSQYVSQKIDLENALNIDQSDLNIKEHTALLNPFKESNERFFFDIGASLFGSVLWHFTHWLKELSKKKNISQINFVMREGQLFKKCFEKLDSNISCNLIFASRKSTFWASLDVSDVKASNFNFYRYRGLSIEDLFALFDLEINDQQLEAVKHRKLSELHCDKPIEKRLYKVFDEQKEKIVNAIKEQKRLLKNYLKELNYQKGSMLVDFGGGGTALKTISQVMKDKKSLHTLFYRHDQGISNLLKNNAFAFFDSNKNDRTIELIRRSHQVLEVLFNGNETTTLGYKKDKKVEPIRDQLPSQMKKNESSLKAFERGVEAFFEIAKRYDLKAKLNIEDSLKRVEGLISMPLIEEADHLGNLYVDQGIGKSFEKIIENRADMILQNNGCEQFYCNYNESLSYQINQIIWPQAELTRFNEEFIRKVSGVGKKTANAQAIDKILKRIDFQGEINEVSIYAAGEFFKELLPYLKQRSIRIKEVFDSRAKVKPFNYEGFDVVSLESKKLEADEYIIIASAVFAKEIKDQISNEISAKIIDCL